MDYEIRKLKWTGPCPWPVRVFRRWGVYLIREDGLRAWIMDCTWRWVGLMSVASSARHIYLPRTPTTVEYTPITRSPIVSRTTKPKDITC